MTLSITVLHETILSLKDALVLFSKPATSDADAGCYHLIISRTGVAVKLVDETLAVPAAANSAFLDASTGLEESYSRAGGVPSVDNFAYHIALESPEDGRDSQALAHSGYTAVQYQALINILTTRIQAGLLLPSRIATHRYVDRSGTRQDPRSLDTFKLSKMLTKMTGQVINLAYLL